MTPAEFHTTLMAARKPGCEHFDVVFDKVREAIRRMEDAQRFALLFPLAVKSQMDAPSYPAAQLLRELSPTCSLSCEEAVRALLPDWNVSIEQVPFYLASRFGVKRVRDAANVVEASAASESAKRMMQTVCNWLNTYEQVYPEKNS